MPPIHIYDLSQQTLAGYWQHTIGLLPTTDFSYGARVQNTSLSARDRYDPNGADCALFFNCSAQTCRSTATRRNTRCMSASSIASTTYSRYSAAPRARSARPMSMSALSSGPAFDAFFNPIPQNFQLKTQTSHDVEGGFRIKSGAFQMQSSIYNMDLENEIHFDPVDVLQLNLDPTRRYGSETSASLRVSDSVLLRGGVAYTRAVFREGPIRGQ